MKWTTIVDHSPYEKTTEELKKMRQQRLAQLEKDAKKFQFMEAPLRLHGMMQHCQELADMYDLEKCERISGEDNSIDTLTTQPTGAEPSKSEVEEEEVIEDTISSEESYYQSDYWRGKEDKKRDLFEMNISVDEDADHDNFWVMDSISDLPFEKEMHHEDNLSEIEDSQDDLEVHVSGLAEVEGDDRRWNHKVFNKFRNKTDDDVRQQWEKDKKRTKPLNVIDTDEALVYEIAEELCEWANSQGLQSPVLTVETISDLFRFKFTDNVVVESMMINVRQLQSVPSKIVKHAPSESTRAELYRQIMWDKIEHDRPDQKNAFFSKVLKKKRIKPDPIREWIETDAIPQELLTTETFFKNLLDSDILEKFVVWLVENPESYQPKYLRDIGYIDNVKTKYGGVNKIMLEKMNRKNRERFQASKFINREDTFLSTIKRMSEIRRLIPPGYKGSSASF
ncbi:uncharacterized protein LOC106670843 isoform X1 [Cimex lectularius]|uniref:Uncharacterized protein n=1 Tax=Cimex lectularius TaxID=79782 RepID=A0A8I6SBW1_CIMLE|nr:uncharacterized protein LOC106670843 isoform X1 [Cimex lectularius]